MLATLVIMNANENFTFTTDPKENIYLITTVASMLCSSSFCSAVIMVIKILFVN